MLVLEEILKVPVSNKPVNKRKKRLVYALSTQEHRETLTNKVSGSIEDENWICYVCKANYEEEIRSKLWLNCDSCNRAVHLNCISEEHKKLTNIKKLIKKQNFTFVCQECN